jgi:hypothetical protein
VTAPRDCSVNDGILGGGVQDKAEAKEGHPTTHEIVRFIGLLVARAPEICRESPSRSWVTKVEGALSRGTFGQFLSRDSFIDIARYLHFNDNAKQAESGDRAFKLRQVLQVLQKTFFRGYRLGVRISFDEGMVPMRTAATRCGSICA